MKVVVAIALTLSICCLWTAQPAKAEENSRPITAWPLIYHRADKGSAETDVFWPLFHYEREDERISYALRPFLFSTESDPKEDSRKTSILWPFTGYNRKKSGISLYIFPVYWYGKFQGKYDKQYNIIFPFYWDGKGRDYSYFHVWPLFGVNHLLHWYENDKKEDKKAVAFFWLYPPDVSLIKYQQQPGRIRNAVFPLYIYDHNESKDSLRWTFLWPLFSYNSRGGDDFSRQTGFLWKVISYDQKGKENRDFRFLWRLIRSNKTDKSYTFEFNPLYYYESGIEGESYWAILGGLLGVETKKNQRKKVRLFWIFG